MVKVELQGVAKVTAKGRTYYYAWRGGPRLTGEPGSQEFLASYNEANANRDTSDPGRFKSLVTRYKGSPDYTKLAASTRKNWAPWLDRIADYFGELRIVQFDRPEKIRPVIRRWRNQWADKPRTADYGIQVLSRVLSYAVDPLGKIAGNPCEGIKQLYSENRSEIIWTESDLVQLKRACTAEIAHAVDLAAHTGLRLGDLLRLSWSHVRADTINDLDRQEQPSPGGDNPALRRAEKRPRKHSEAVDYSPHQQQASALDSERLWQLFRQSEDRGWVRGS
jgi:hypothetical protein